MNKRVTAKHFLIWAISYFVLAKLSMLLFSAQPSNISLLWYPSGLALYLFYRSGYSVLPAIFVASFCSNFSGLAAESLMHQILHTCVSASADTLFALIAGKLMQKYLPDGTSSPAHLFPFFIACCLLPIAFTSSILAINLWWGNYVSTELAITTGFSILMADILGVLLIMPLLLAYHRRKDEILANSNIWIIATGFALGFIAMSFYVAHWLIYFALPSLLYIVFKNKTFYSYLSLLIAITVYNAIAADYYSFPYIDANRLDILAFSLAISVAVIAIATQQRMLLSESMLRQLWQTRASHDSLTGLVNRNVIMPMIENEISRSRRQNGTFSLVMLDLDKFKNINDTYGHAAGDKLLVEFSHRLNQHIRSSDKAARIGGEEFLLLLPDTSAEQAHTFVNKLKSHITGKPFELGEISLDMTFSAGIAQANQTSSVETLLASADSRLYIAKHAGRDQICHTSD